MRGAVERVRPKMMTVVAIMAGLLPILWSTGTGSEVMQRIAVPMIGGMVSSTILTLIVIPAHLRPRQGVGIDRRRRCEEECVGVRMRRQLGVARWWPKYMRLCAMATRQVRRS